MRFKDEPGNNYRDWEKVQFSCIAAKVNDIYNPTNNRSRFKSIELDSLMSNTGQLLNTYNSDEQKSMKSKFKVGDVLFGKLRPYLRKFYLARFDGVCTSEIWVLRPKSVPSNFLYQTVQSHMFSRVANIQSGTKMPRSDWRVVSQSEFKIPIDYKEQQKIAAFLSSVDTKIEQLGKKKALLEQYKKGMMQKLFSQEIRFKDEQGNNYPDWEKVKFSSLYSFQPTNSFSRDRLNYKDGRVRNIHYGDIHTKYRPGFELDKENVPFLESGIDLGKVSEASCCKEGDLVIADASEDYSAIGKTIELLNLNSEQVLAGLHTILARLNTDRVHVGYGAYVMACCTVKLQVMRIAHGTKVLGISAGRMGKIELPLPSREEQQKIADFLSAIDRKIELVAAQIGQTRAFKKGLLQQMFI